MKTKILKILKKEGYNIDTLSEAVEGKISRTDLEAYLNSRKRLSPLQIVALAKALNVKSVELIDLPQDIKSHDLFPDEY